MEVMGQSCGAVALALRDAGLLVSTGSYTTRASGRCWIVKTDSSLRPNDANRSRGNQSGVEVVSPPLRGKAGFAELKKACDALNAAGVEVNKTCGLHVHHEAKDFTVDTFRSLCLTYAAAQSKIDAVLAASRRSSARNRYCASFSSGELSMIRTATTVEQMSRSINRYHVLNLSSFGSYGTIEFRQHQGSTDFQKIRAWILAGQAMVRAAKKGQTSTADSFGDMVDEFGTKAGVGRYFKTRARKLSGREPESRAESDTSIRNDLNPAGIGVGQVTVQAAVNNFAEAFSRGIADTMRNLTEAFQAARDEIIIEEVEDTPPMPTAYNINTRDFVHFEFGHPRDNRSGILRNAYRN